MTTTEGDYILALCRRSNAFIRLQVVAIQARPQVERYKGDDVLVLLVCVGDA